MPFIYQGQKIITVSESSRKQILKLGFSNPEDISVINPGVELSNFILLPKTEYPSLFYLGRLKPYKNIDVIIKAFKEVLQIFPKAKLAMAGSGESLDELQALTKTLDIEKSVTFFGKVSDKRKAELLARSWVMLQPSMIEGWGITVIEANASGTPVIASKVNGLIDSVKDKQTGVLVTPKNIREWTVEINQLLSNTKLRNNLSAEAYEWSKNFSWDQSALLLDELIHSILIDIPNKPGTGLEPVITSPLALGRSKPE
jgi:glycosyltransferase involved in cell wall biosynthesis